MATGQLVAVPWTASRPCCGPRGDLAASKVGSAGDGNCLLCLPLGPNDEPGNSALGFRTGRCQRTPAQTLNRNDSIQPRINPARQSDNRDAFDTDFTNLHEFSKLVPIRVKRFAQLSQALMDSSTNQ